MDGNKTSSPFFASSLERNSTNLRLASSEYFWQRLINPAPRFRSTPKGTTIPGGAFLGSQEFAFSSSDVKWMAEAWNNSFEPSKRKYKYFLNRLIHPNRSYRFSRQTKSSAPAGRIRYGIR